MYKVTQFIRETSVDGFFELRKYITVQSGLTWQQAKELQRKTRGSQIVRTA